MRNIKISKMTCRFLIFLSIFCQLRIASLSFDLEVRNVHNFNRNPELFPMNRHALHYDLMLSQNRDRSLYQMPLLFTKDKFLVKVVIDTGSSVLWIDSLACNNIRAEQTCGKFVSYLKYGYLDGPIEGNMIRAEVYLNNDILCNDTYVLLVEKTAKSMEDPLVGLGPRTSEYPTFMEKMMENKVINENEFTIDLKNKKITFGKFESEKEEKIAAVFMNPLSYTVGLNRLALFDVNIFGIVHDAIIDSGNTLIAIPSIFKEAIMRAYSSIGLECYVQKESNPSFSNILCVVEKSREIFGSMEFWFGNELFWLKDEELFGDCFIYEGRRMCKSVIEMHDFNNGVILGQPFFMKHKVTFNLEKNQAEFWRAKKSTAGIGESEAMSV